MRPLSGFDLATRRRRQGLTQQAIAEVLGVRRERIAVLEGLRRPTGEAQARYLAALRELTVR